MPSCITIPGSICKKLLTSPSRSQRVMEVRLHCCGTILTSLAWESSLPLDGGAYVMCHARLVRPGTRLFIQPRALLFSCKEICKTGNPYITPIYYSSFHFLFHYPYITPIYYSSFHFLFHYPYITPIYYSSFHFIFHSPACSPHHPTCSRLRKTLFNSNMRPGLVMPSI